MKKVGSPDAIAYSTLVSMLAQKGFSAFSYLFCFIHLISTVISFLMSRFTGADEAIDYWFEMIQHHTPQARAIIEFVHFLRKRHSSLETQQKRDQVAEVLRVSEACKSHI